MLLKYRQLRLALKITWAENYPRKTYFFFEVASVFSNFFIYFFTSKAFSKSLETHFGNWCGDYFSYIVFAEITMIIPYSLIQGPIQKIKQWHHLGTLDYFLTQKQSLWSQIMIFNSSEFIRHLLRMSLMLALSFFFTDWNFDFSKTSWLIVWWILGIPLYLGLGLCSCCIFMVLGRGENLMGHFINIMAFFAGAYFPIEVLPDYLGPLTDYLNPFYNHLQGMRDIYSGDNFSLVLDNHGRTFGGSLFLIISYYLFPLALQKLYLQNDVLESKL